MPISNFFDPRPSEEAAKARQETIWGNDVIKEQLATSAAERARQSALAIETIQQSKAKREDDRVRLDLEKKKTESELQLAVHKGELTQVAADMLREQMKAKEKQTNELLDANDLIADHEHHKHVENVKQSAAFLQSLAQVPPPDANLTPKSVISQPTSMTSIPMGGRVPPQQEEIPRYEVDMASAFSGEPKVVESPMWKKQEEAKIKQDFTINALKIDEGDKEILNQVYQARKQGQDLSREEIMANLSPVTATAIQGLIDYSDDPNIYSKRNNAQAEAIQMARMVDPTYDPTKYAERKKYRLELASESSFVGKQKTALNTVAQHIDQLDGYIDALGGGNIKPVNMVINFAKEMTGNPNIATYEQASEAVMSEMQRLLTGVGVTQAGMAEARKIVDRNTGYEAKKKALQSLVKIVEGRVSPLRQSFRQKMGKEESGEIVFPETQAIFDKHLSQTETLPPGVTEEDIQHTMKKHNVTREQVLQRIRG